MLSFERVNSWNIRRLLRKQPFGLLGELVERGPLLFNLGGEPILLSAYQVQLDSAEEMMTSPHIRHVELSTWLSSFQRFLGVKLTHILEGTDGKGQLNIQDLLRLPLTWSLGHSLFRVELRKAHTRRDQAYQDLLIAAEQGMDDSTTRMMLHRPLISFYSKRKLNTRIKEAQMMLSEDQLLMPSDLQELRTYLQLKRQVYDVLIWLSIYLSRKEELTEQIFTELCAHLASRAYQPSDLQSLPLLHMSILETLRLAPPHWVTEAGVLKQTLQTDGSRRGELPAGTRLFFSPLISHMDVSEWPSPLTFEPKRFFSVTHGAELPLSFVPLGIGEKGKMNLEWVLHTVAAAASSILRRGRLLPISPSSEELSTQLDMGTLYAPIETGVSLGAPKVQFRFQLNDRFIHIPSARI